MVNKFGQFLKGFDAVVGIEALALCDGVPTTIAR
jgi:hypothetical protein